MRRQPARRAAAPGSRDDVEGDTGGGSRTRAHARRQWVDTARPVGKGRGNLPAKTRKAIPYAAIARLKGRMHRGRAREVRGGQRTPRGMGWCHASPPGPGASSRVKDGEGDGVWGNGHTRSHDTSLATRRAAAAESKTQKNGTPAALPVAAGVPNTHVRTDVSSRRTTQTSNSSQGMVALCARASKTPAASCAAAFPASSASSLAPSSASSLRRS